MTDLFSALASSALGKPLAPIRPVVAPVFAPGWRNGEVVSPEAGAAPRGSVVAPAHRIDRRSTTERSQAEREPAQGGRGRGREGRPRAAEPPGSPAWPAGPLDAAALEAAPGPEDPAPESPRRPPLRTFALPLEDRPPALSAPAGRAGDIGEPVPPRPRPGPAQAEPSARVTPSIRVSRARPELTTGEAADRPVVHVTIGRVEVRAVRAPEPAPSPRSGLRRPELRLEDYLRQRSEGA